MREYDTSNLNKGEISNPNSEHQFDLVLTQIIFVIHDTILRALMKNDTDYLFSLAFWCRRRIYVNVIFKNFQKEIPSRTDWYDQRQTPIQ